MFSPTVENGKPVAGKPPGKSPCARRIDRLFENVVSSFYRVGGTECRYDVTPAIMVRGGRDNRLFRRRVIRQSSSSFRVVTGPSESMGSE